MKYEYTKLTLFKVLGYDCKSDEKKSGMVSEVFPTCLSTFWMLLTYNVW
jgi:hypothetical protein